MAYPTVLIPRPDFRYIDLPAHAAEHHLLRKHQLAAEELFDPITGRVVKEEYIEQFSKNVKDVSTSLLGTFRPEHYDYLLINLSEARRDYLVFDAWPPGETVAEPPVPAEVDVRSPATLYHVPFAKVHDLDFTFDYRGESFDAKLRVLHTPCRSNFWHCSIRVFDDKEEDIASRYPHSTNRKVNKRDKEILKAARQAIQVAARPGVPDFTPLPEAVYLA